MVAQGHVFWLFGLSGAGKSTLADRLAEDFRIHGVPVLRLDGDMLRGGLCAGLGFTESDRAENLRRAAEVAKLGTASGLIVVASFITPGESHRTRIREIIGSSCISLIFVNASLDVCRQRDVKGLYAQASHGNISRMTGISSPFETPKAVELVLETSHDSVEVSGGILRNFAMAKIATASS